MFDSANSDNFIIFINLVNNSIGPSAKGMKTFKLASERLSSKRVIIEF